MKALNLFFIMACAFMVTGLTACHTTKKTAVDTTPASVKVGTATANDLPANTNPAQDNTISPQAVPMQTAIVPPSFAITGKIGVTTLDANGKKQAGSAFYAWGQQGERFAIDLTGALGLGATSIRYNGKTATLISEQAGELTADSPEELLYKATGWHAPIRQLPFWIMGKTTPDDSDIKTANNQLSSATNGDWQATFDYNKTDLPNRIRIVHKDGYRVVLSVNER